MKGAPKNPLCKFERASILFSSERYGEALAELEELKILAPKESPVYFLMGKVCISNFKAKKFCTNCLLNCLTVDDYIINR